MPSVDDLVLRAMDEGEALIDRRAVVALAHHEAQHVPVGIVDAGRERPASGNLIAAVDLAAAAAGNASDVAISTSVETSHNLVLRSRG